MFDERTLKLVTSQLSSDVNKIDEPYKMNHPGAGAGAENGNVPPLGGAPQPGGAAQPVGAGAQPGAGVQPIPQLGGALVPAAQLGPGGAAQPGGVQP